MEQTLTGKNLLLAFLKSSQYALFHIYTVKQQFLQYQYIGYYSSMLACHLFVSTFWD